MMLQRPRDLAAALLVAFVFGIGHVCSASAAPPRHVTMKQAQEKVAEAARAIKDYSVEQKDQVIKKVKEALDDLDSRIDTLETHLDKNWGKMDRAAREKERAALRSLRRQRNQVAEWYGGLKHSSTGAWAQMKQGLSQAYSSLQDAWEKAEKEFRSDH